MNGYKAIEENGKWFMKGKDLKIETPNKEYAEVLSNIFPNIEITDPNFKPGRRKKSL